MHVFLLAHKLIIRTILSLSWTGLSDKKSILDNLLLYRLLRECFLFENQRWRHWSCCALVIAKVVGRRRLLKLMVGQGPHIHLAIKRERGEDRVFGMPGHLPRGCILWMCGLKDCCGISSLCIINIDLTIGWSSVNISLSSSLNRGKVALKMHILNIMPFKCEQRLIACQLNLFISQWIVLGSEVEICPLWLFRLIHLIIRKHHTHVPQFNKLIFWIWCQIISVLTSHNVGNAFCMPYETTSETSIIIHYSLIPNLNNSWVTAGCYNVRWLIFMTVNVASIVNFMLMCILKLHKLAIDLGIVEYKFTKRGRRNYFLAIPHVFNRW